MNLNYRSSIKVDKNGVDQSISGTVPTIVDFSRVRWDLNGDFYNGHFYPPTDGLYFSGSVLVIKNALNCTAVSMDLYRNGEFYQRIDQGTPSVTGYLVLRGAAMVPGLQSGADYFDLYITLSGVSPSATIDATTAWSTFFYTGIDASEIT